MTELSGYAKAWIKLVVIGAILLFLTVIGYIGMAIWVAVIKSKKDPDDDFSKLSGNLKKMLIASAVMIITGGLALTVIAQPGKRVY
jgi:hypothetical protein